MGSCTKKSCITFEKAFDKVSIKKLYTYGILAEVEEDDCNLIYRGTS